MLALSVAVFLVSLASAAFADSSNLTIRVMSANLTSGNNQRYEAPGLDIFQGLKPDVVCLQEFNYASTNGQGTDTPAAIREMVDSAFGTNFYYFRETNSEYSIPNGIISRYPIVNSGSKMDEILAGPNRGYAWAQIRLPGTNDLYVVSVHLYSGGTATDRNNEALAIQSLVQTNFPADAWVIVAGDFNTDSRNEAAVTTFKTFLSDSPIPTDLNGNPETNRPRNKPYDYLLPNFSLTNRLVPVVLPSHTLANGLVFISTNYVPLSDVSPVQFSDSDAVNMQHMAVIKDFLIPTDEDLSSAPAISSQPQSQVIQSGSNVTFSVSAYGTDPLAYQWLFNGTNIQGAMANSYTITNVQFTNAGNYSVFITNILGSATSSVAVLTVTNYPPSILNQPQSRSVSIGDAVTFNVTAGGANPLAYQWRFNGTNLSGAQTNFYAITNVQLINAGDYSVVVTNIAGSLTSSVAVLSIFTTQSVAFAQWNFNSVTPDNDTTSGTSSPSTGSGIAAPVGGLTTTFATGDTAFDPAGTTDNSGWNTVNYPASTSNNKTAGVQFKASTLGKTNIVITWSQRASNTGSKYARLQYSTNGINFVDFPTAVSVGAGTVFEVKTNNLLGISGVCDNANFAFRIVAEFQNTATGSGSAAYVAANSGSSYAGGSSGGTLRFDMVTVSGLTIVTNAPAAVLTGTIFDNNQFHFNLTGSTGVTYIVQTSTNLAGTGWIPVFTNTLPFSFTDLDLTLPQKFYRGITAP